MPLAGNIVHLAHGIIREHEPHAAEHIRAVELAAFGQADPGKVVAVGFAGQVKVAILGVAFGSDGIIIEQVIQQNADGLLFYRRGGVVARFGFPGRRGARRLTGPAAGRGASDREYRARGYATSHLHNTMDTR